MVFPPPKKGAKKKGNLPPWLQSAAARKLAKKKVAPKGKKGLPDKFAAMRK